MSEAQALRRLLRDHKALLLDFDGPIAHVFAGRPAASIAAELRAFLGERGRTSEVVDEHDPLVLYRSTADDPNLAAALSERLTAAEIDAVMSAAPTEGAHEVIRAAHAGGWHVAIVSNNSAAAVTAYLARHGLSNEVEHVAARRTAEPALMKPSPAYVREATEALAIAPTACAMVGDSPSDIEAAHAIGATAIGYANKPGKAERLAEADAVITGMAELLDALA